MSHPLIDSVDLDLLEFDFDENSVQRGLDYAERGQVLSTKLSHASAGAVKVLGQVSGSRGRSYSVLVNVDLYAGRPEISSYCSCPVSRQCKHGVAALWAAAHASAATPTAPSWERDLTELLSDLEGPEPTELKRLAIQFELRAASRVGVARPAGLTMRLLQQGARGNWIKTGIKWSDAPVLRSRTTFDPTQVEAAHDLYAQWDTPRFHYAGSTEAPSLDEFGPRLWSLLSAAGAAGIALLPPAGFAEVRVAAEPAELTVDTSSTPQETTVRARAVHDGRTWSGPDVIVVGRRAHGLVLIGDGPSGRVLVLAELARRAPVSLIRLLTSPEPLRVPAESRDRFIGTYLPRLAREVRATSSDGTVVIPEAPHPSVLLTVAWDSATTAEVRWEWRYADRTVLLDSADRLDGLRDRAAEEELRSRLPVPVAEAVHKISGPDALELAVHLLPAIAAVDGVEVVEVERPDFRPAAGEIGISFTSVDPEESTPTDWLDLLVTVHVEGEQVPLPTVLEALTLGHAHVVLPSGLYVETDRPEFAALEDLVRAAAELSEQPADRVSIGTHDLGLWAQLAEIGLVDEQAAAWVAKARSLRDLTDLPRPAPVGITSTLRGYQLEGFHWLAFLWAHQLGGILADDMGLGKTVQVLALISHARADGAAPFLVVAPSSVVSAWRAEAARHAPGLRVEPITASRSRRGGRSVADIAADADVVVTTYTLLRLEQEDYAAVAWGGVVLDEAQQVKNHQGKTYRAVRTLGAPFTLAVTGTPFENRLMELWALLSITVPGLYPWPQAFGKQVVAPVEKRGDPEVLRRFRQRIRPFLLRRTKELVAGDLPPKQEQVLELALSGRHRRIYDTHLQKERQKILGLLDDFDQNRVAIFSALTRLRMLALDPALVDPEHASVGSAKLDALAEHLVDIAAGGHRALVFSQFTSYLQRVRARLDTEGVTTCYLDGSTRDRAAVIDEWRTSDAAAFLISLKAGGVGLTLTEADYVFVLDPWWNPAAEAQAVDRAHRIGQSRPVLVYRLVAADTIEEKVMELKARKARLFSQVVDGDGLLATAIGADEIRGLLDD